MKWLVFGYKGWIGQQVVKILESDSKEHTDLGIRRSIISNKKARLSRMSATICTGLLY